MSPRQKTTHYLGQLYAAVAVFTAACGLFAVALPASDGPDAAFWGPTLGGALVAVGVSGAVLPLVFYRSIVAARLEMRAAAAKRRPVPGIGRAISWTDREFEAMAEAWLAEEPADVPPVDPLAAERPRPEPETHGRHAGDAEDEATYESTLAAWAASEEAYEVAA